MAYRDRPEFCAPDDQRCEALTKPVKDTYQVWRREPHQCVRRAVQSRAGRVVCHLHARMENVKFINNEER